jgi:O-antigen/teichoic acid export membrane protein
MMMPIVPAADGPGRRRSKLVDLLLSQVVPLAASSLMTLATALILGSAGRGELALVLSGGALLGALGFLSLHVGIVRAYREGDATAPLRGWLIGAMIALTIFAAGWCLFLNAPALQLGLFNRATVLLIALGGGLVLFNLVVLRTRQGLGDSRVFRNSWFLQSILFPVVGIPVALLSHSSYLVALCWYLALAASTIYGMTAKSERGRLGSPKRVSSGRIVTNSLAAHTGTVGQQLLFRGDVVVLGFLASASSVGIYSIAMPIAGLIWVFSEALSLLAFDSGDRHTSPGKRHRDRRQLVKANFIYGGAGAVVVGLGSWLLLPLFLPQFSAAVPIILILLPGVLIQGWARIGLSSILTTGSVRAPVTIGIFSAGLSVLYIPFVMHWGVVGAAVASTFIYCLQTLVVVAVTHRLNKLPESKEHDDE